MGEELELRTSKVDISERISRTSRAAWRFLFGSLMLDWGMAVAGCSLGVCHGSLNSNYNYRVISVRSFEL